MKKIISCCKYGLQGLIVLSFWSILFLAFSILALGFEIFDLVEEKGAGYLSFVFFFSVSVFFFWYLNRLACVVWVENGIVKRKGLIVGFYKECPISSIQTVIIQYAYREGDFIYLVDNSTHKFNRIRKDSYICFCKTKKNLDFLRTFWSGEVEK